LGITAIESIKRGRTWKHITRGLGPARKNKIGRPRKVKISRPRKNRKIGIPVLCLNHRHCLSLTQNFFDATCTPLTVRIMTQSAAAKALETSVRKLSCILCLCEDVRMTSTGNDDRLDAQDPTRRRLLPLWPDLVVSRSRNVHVVDLRQRFQRTDFVEADHGMSG